MSSLSCPLAFLPVLLAYTLLGRLAQKAEANVSHLPAIDLVNHPHEVAGDRVIKEKASAVGLGYLWLLFMRVDCPPELEPSLRQP